MDELVEAHHAVALFVARAIASDATALEIVERAWASLMKDVCLGRLKESLREALVSRVLTQTPRPEPVRSAGRPAAMGTFVGAGDRWEGWWDDEPTGWHAADLPRPDHVLDALRALPFQERVVLLLSEVGGLSARRIAEVVDSDHRVDTLLDLAMDDYLVLVDRAVVTHE